MVEKTIGNKQGDSVTVNYTLADSCDDTTLVGATSSVSWLSATVSTPSNHAGTITITATEDGTDVTRYAFITPSINGEPCDNNRIKITQSSGEPPEPEPCKKFVVDGGEIKADKTGDTGCDSAFLYYEGTPIFTPADGANWITINYYHWDTDPAGYMCSNYAAAPCVANNLMAQAGIEGVTKIDNCRTASTNLSDYPQVVQDAVNKTGEYKHALGTLSYIIAPNNTGADRECVVTFKVNSLECPSKEYTVTQTGSDTPTTCESCSDFGITDRVDYPVPATGYTYANPVKELKTNCDPDNNFTVEHKSGDNILISMSIGRQGAKSYLITGTAAANPSTTTELSEVISIKYNGVECTTTTITQRKSGDVPVPCDDPCENLNINLPVSSEGIRTITATSEAGNASFTYKCCQDLYVRKGSSTANWITVSKSYNSSTSAGTVSITYDANTTTSTRDCAILFSIEEDGEPCNDQLKIPVFKQDGESSTHTSQVTVFNQTTKTGPKIGFYNTNNIQVGGIARYNAGETTTSITWTDVAVPVYKIDYVDNQGSINYIKSITVQKTGQPPVFVLENAQMTGNAGSINLTQSFNPSDCDFITVTFKDSIS